MTILSHLCKRTFLQQHTGLLLQCPRYWNLIGKYCMSFSHPHFKDSNIALNEAVSHAERIVGFPTSFLSLRALLSDELSAVALHIRKLVNTNHPLLNTARKILFDSKDNVQERGLVLLLLSKALTDDVSGMDQLKSSEAFSSQRSLAELTELIHTAFLVHRGIVNRISLKEGNCEKYQSEMDIGNKMAVLSGDFLLANACTALANLQNLEVVDLMSKAISDMSHGFFILPECGIYSQIPSLENLPDTVDKWENVTYLAYASLLSNACRCVTELSAQSNKYGDICASFGKHMALANQAKLDVQRITEYNGSNKKMNLAPSELCALPVTITAEQNGGKIWFERFLSKSKESDNLNLNVEELRSVVSNYLPALEKAKEVRNLHKDLALHFLKQLPSNKARTSLELLTCAFSDD